MVAELGARKRVAVEVVERDDLVVVHEAAGERRPDEAGAAGDEDPLAAQRHAASLATCPSSAGPVPVVPGRRQRAPVRGGRIDIRVVPRRARADV